MRHEEFVNEVMRRAGFQQPAMASLAIDSTLEILGQRLLRDEARELAEQVPPAFREALLRGPHGGSFDRQELYRRISGREGVRLGFAVEHAQVVCQVAAEAIDEGLQRRLHRQLPTDIGDLLMPRPQPAAAPRRPSRVTPGYGTTLATGRPGTRREPVADADSRDAAPLLDPDD